MDPQHREDEKHTSAAPEPPRGPKAQRQRSRSPRNHPSDERRYRDRARDRDEPLHDASNRHKDSERHNEEKRMAKALFSKDRSRSHREEEGAGKSRGRDGEWQKGGYDRRDRYREDDDDRKHSSSSKRDDRDRRETNKSNTNQSVRDKFGDKAGSPAGKESEKKQNPPPQPQSSEPMIVVTVNDRLGTKAQIPCFASDNVGLFKAQVAQRIGRKPHEIMLKRQGERPFKDMLSLEDYGVSSGVQLDLELDTGD